MIKACLLVAAGGALGAVGRHLVTAGTAAWLGSAFPFGTLAVNVAGSFLLGALAGLLVQAWSPPDGTRLLLATGFLGAFTTFSAFSLDAVNLFERGSAVLAGLYVAASVILSIGALVAGMRLARAMLS